MRDLTSRGFLLCFFLFPFFLFGSELSSPLRQAEELFRIGQLDEAKIIAESVHLAFPKDLNALLILGRIQMERKDLSTAKRFFQMAHKINRNHPMVKHYQKIFEEIEHRRGILSDSFLPLPHPDKTMTAEKFRKGWFGPGFIKLFPPVTTVFTTQPDNLGVATAPPGAILGKSIDFLANQALEKKWYLKAYLLYKDLLRDYPDHPDFILGAAEASLGIRRYREAMTLIMKVQSLDPGNEKALFLLSQIPSHVK